MNLTLFDLDGTLLAIDSDHAFGEFMVRLGWADGEDFRRANDQFYAQYQAEQLDVDAYIRFATSAWRERPAQEQAAASQRFIDEMIRPAVHDAARALLRRHVEAGDRVAIVTATNEFITRPIATLFGVDRTHRHRTAARRRWARHRRSAGRAGLPRRQGHARAAVAGAPGPGAAKTSSASPSTAIPPTTCRCSSASATRWRPTPRRRWNASPHERGWPILRLFA